MKQTPEERLIEKKKDLKILQNWFYGEEKYIVPALIRVTVYEKIQVLKNEIKILEEN